MTRHAHITSLITGMSCRVLHCRVVSCTCVSGRVVSCRAVSCPVLSCHVTSRHVPFRHVTPRHATPRHVTARHVKSRHVTSCHVMKTMSDHVHVQSRKITSCHIISCYFHATSRHARIHEIKIRGTTLNCRKFQIHHCILFGILFDTSLTMSNYVMSCHRRVTLHLT